MATPYICAPCLGDKDHVRLKRQPNGEECRFCTRPFVTFRWSSDSRVGKMRKTVICDTCARARKCCQACSADIDYHIPLELRDAALKLAGLENPWSVENTSRNKEVRAIAGDKLEKRVKNTRECSKQKEEKTRAILSKLAEKLLSKPASAQTASVSSSKTAGSSKDVASAISNLPFGGSLAFPKDLALGSFFVFGFSSSMPQYKLQEYFAAHGAVQSMQIIHRARCGYVSYRDRAAAEVCANFVALNGLNSNLKTAGLALIDNQPVRISWGAPQKLGNNIEEQTKIALAVTKIMKQLAERDAQQKRRGNETLKRQKVAPKAKTKEEQPAYKALAPDVEL